MKRLHEIKKHEPSKSTKRTADNLNMNAIKLVLKDQILKIKKQANEWKFNKKQASIEKDNQILLKKLVEISVGKRRSANFRDTTNRLKMTARTTGLGKNDSLISIYPGQNVAN